MSSAPVGVGHAVHRRGQCARRSARARRTSRRRAKARRSRYTWRPRPTRSRSSDRCSRRSLARAARPTFACSARRGVGAIVARPSTVSPRDPLTPANSSAVAVGSVSERRDAELDRAAGRCRAAAPSPRAQIAARGAARRRSLSPVEVVICASPLCEYSGMCAATSKRPRNAYAPPRSISVRFAIATSSAVPVARSSGLSAYDSSAPRRRSRRTRRPTRTARRTCCRSSTASDGTPTRRDRASAPAHLRAPSPCWPASGRGHGDPPPRRRRRTQYPRRARRPPAPRRRPPRHSRRRRARRRTRAVPRTVTFGARIRIVIEVERHRRGERAPCRSASNRRVEAVGRARQQIDVLRARRAA